MSLSQYHGKSPQELDHTSRAYTGQRKISIALFLSVLYLTSNGPITVATMQLKAKDIPRDFSPKYSWNLLYSIMITRGSQLISHT